MSRPTTPQQPDRVALRLVSHDHEGHGRSRLRPARVAPVRNVRHAAPAEATTMPARQPHWYAVVALLAALAATHALMVLGEPSLIAPPLLALL